MAACDSDMQAWSSPVLPERGAGLTVVVGGSRFPAEKALLLQGSGYFQALFRSGMKESRQDTIHLQNLSARGFLTTMEVLRGERPLLLDGDQITEAAECASFLQVAPLTKHLVDLLDSDNCLLMYHSATVFGLGDLLHAAALFIRDAYRELEAELWETLPPGLVSHVESLSPSVLAAVGAHGACGAGDTVHAASRTLCYLDERENTWKVLTELPPQASTSMAGVTVLDNKLYVVGGVQGISKRAVDGCFRYSVEDNEWSAIACPAQLRYNLTLIGLDARLYAVGGECERIVMSSVETYHVETGRWSHAGHLPRPTAGAACAKTMSRLFVCLWKPPDTTEIYEYLAGREEWSPVTTLVRRQSYGHCLVGHRDDLYVVRNGPSDDFLRCLIDCYNLTTGQWSALPGHFANSKGSLFTSVVRGDSVLTVNRSMTQEFHIEGRNWRPRGQRKGFPRSGSLWTFLLRLPSVSHNKLTANGMSGQGLV